jgi:hypothetical protein
MGRNVISVVGTASLNNDRKTKKLLSAGNAINAKSVQMFTAHESNF